MVDGKTNGNGHPSYSSLSADQSSPVHAQIYLTLVPFCISILSQLRLNTGELWPNTVFMVVGETTVLFSQLFGKDRSCIRVLWLFSDNTTNMCFLLLSSNICQLLVSVAPCLIVSSKFIWEIHHQRKHQHFLFTVLSPNANEPPKVLMTPGAWGSAKWEGTTLQARQHGPKWNGPGKPASSHRPPPPLMKLNKSWWCRNQKLDFDSLITSK